VRDTSPLAHRFDSARFPSGVLIPYRRLDCMTQGSVGTEIRHLHGTIRMAIYSILAGRPHVGKIVQRSTEDLSRCANTRGDNVRRSWAKRVVRRCKRRNRRRRIVECHRSLQVCLSVECGPSWTLAVDSLQVLGGSQAGVVF
jgi:hypothetical protein